MGFEFRVGYGYPWIICSGKIRVWVLSSIDNRVSMGKFFESGMGIPDPYPTHGHPYNIGVFFFLLAVGFVLMVILLPDL